MKKLFLAVAFIIAFTPYAFAGDFDYGQTPDGCYYFNANKSIAYSKDASLIGDAQYCKSLGSSVWYIRQIVDNGRVDNAAYWNRINAMAVIVKK